MIYPMASLSLTRTETAGSRPCAGAGNDERHKIRIETLGACWRTKGLPFGQSIRIPSPWYGLGLVGTEIASASFLEDRMMFARPQHNFPTPPSAIQTHPLPSDRAGNFVSVWNGDGDGSLGRAGVGRWLCRFRHVVQVDCERSGQVRQSG